MGFKTISTRHTGVVVRTFGSFFQLKCLSKKSATGFWIYSAIAVFLLFPTSAQPQVSNPDGLFESIEVCGGYARYLDGENSPPTAGCHRLAKFLIENKTPDVSAFLAALADFSGPDSSHAAFANTMQATVHQDAPQAYMWSDLAGVRLAVNFAPSGDVERLAFYMVLLSDIRRAAAKSLCTPEDECAAIERITRPSDVLGSEYRAFDDVPPDYIFLCLLKSDALLTPISDVLFSKRFNGCIENGFGEDK